MFSEGLGNELLAEFLGTTVFLTGISRSASVLQVVLCLLGAILMSVKVSGAHLNPLVTCGKAVVENMAPVAVVGYICAQILGAATASGLARVLSETDYNNPVDLNLDNDDPIKRKENEANYGHKFLGEMIGSMVFLSIVLASKSVADVSGIPVPIQVIVGLYTGATIASHWSGGQLNPAVTVMQMINNREGAGAGMVNIVGQFVGLGLGIGLLVLFGISSIGAKDTPIA